MNYCVTGGTGFIGRFLIDRLLKRDGTVYGLVRKGSKKKFEALEAKCFEHVSSIAVADKYTGTFREDMFEEAEELVHPYFQTKHESESVVRKQCEIPFRVYRPASVVGDSQTGEIDKVDGPYYSFKVLQKLRNALPPWFPLIGVEAGAFCGITGSAILIQTCLLIIAARHCERQSRGNHRCRHRHRPGVALHCSGRFFQHLKSKPNSCSAQQVTSTRSYFSHN